MGDFNQVLSNEDKLSFGTQACPGVNDLHDCLPEESMIPVNANRVKFTWNNNRDDEDLVLEWLDKAFVNGEWLNSFEHSSLEAWPITVSDHAPIILDTYRMQTFRKKPQRFEGKNRKDLKPCVYYTQVVGKSLKIHGDKIHLVQQRKY